MKIITYFGLNKEYTLIQSVVDQFAEIDFSIGLKSFVLFLSPYIFTKKFYEAGLKLK
jgi:hypothetical protein